MAILIIQAGTSKLMIEVASSGVTPPDAPSGLVATAFSDSEIDLTWSDNSTNEDGFAIEQSPNGTTAWAEIDQAAADVESYRVSGLTANTDYWFRIVAFNTGGQSAASNVDSATTLTSGATDVTIWPTQVAAARAKATANTTQWQGFKTALDADLGAVIPGTFTAQWMTYILNYALGFLCLETSSPSLAADYGDKAVGLMKAGTREYQSAPGVDYTTWQYLARGNGSTTAYTLAHTPLAGTFEVKTVDVFHLSRTRGA